MAYTDALFQLGMDLTRSSTAQKEDHGQTAHVAQDVREDIFIERDGVRCAGTHLIVDLYGARRLDDLKLIKETLRRCVDVAGANALHTHLHRFAEDGGVSGVAVLAEGHISIRTWPKAGCVALDIFMGRDADPHAIGDLIVSRAGDVFATDSRAPVVYRIAAGTDSLERFVESPLLLSAQGLALTDDERTLYVADYARGILRVNLADRGVTLVRTADSVLALGIDGLYYQAGHLIGIQNGVTPHRVVRLDLAPGGDRMLGARVLERAHPRYDEPTLGVLVAGELYYIANSQWERFGQDGAVSDSTALQRPVVLRLPL